MKTVSVAQAAIAQEAVLPARVQEALGELVGAAREGLLALSVIDLKPRRHPHDLRSSTTPPTDSGSGHTTLHFERPS
jgi:hypothetical protein